MAEINPLHVNRLLLIKPRTITDDAWDIEHTIPLEEDRFFPASYKLFETQTPEGSEFYRLYLKRQGHEDALKHTRAYLDLFHSIQKHGYLPADRCKGLPAIHAHNRGDVRVAVDRHGRLVFAQGGRHRLAISRWLRLDSIPADVILVHVGGTNF